MSNSIILPQQRQQAGGDQARGLRALVARRMTSSESSKPPARACHTIVVSGGKGGVGRSVISLNLAVILAQLGGEVGLLDASPDFGNIELLCGLNGYWNFSHVLQGSRQLHEVLLTGPAGVTILSGVSELVESSRLTRSMTGLAFEQLDAFERKLDWLVIDGSGGTSALTREFALAADDTLIVTTPESTAVAESYSSVKSIASAVRTRIGLLVNQADSAAQANQILDRLQQATKSLLQVDLHRRGYVPRDNMIPTSVNERVPFAIKSPQSPATRELLNLAKRWTRRPLPDDGTSFFSRLLKHENKGESMK